MQTLRTIETIQSLSKDHSKILLKNLEISPSLKKVVLGPLYKTLFNQGVYEISCEISSIQFICHYDRSNPPKKSSQKLLHIKFVDDLVFSNLKIT